MTITRDDNSKALVKICDAHAEEATVKSAREAYNKRMEQIQQVMEQAKALGLNISESKSGISVAKQEHVERPQSNNSSVQPTELKGLILDPNDPSVVRTSRLNSREFRSVTGSVQGQSLETHQAYDPNAAADKLDPSALDGYAQMAINEGRAGQHIAIPTIRQDKTGTTTIIINKSENDASLQARSKRIAEASMGNENMNYKDGYAGQRLCPLCRGVGFINTGKTRPACPKCKGLGSIITV